MMQSVQERVVREIRPLRAMWRVLETEPRQFLTGHEEGNLGYMPRKCLRATAPVPDPTVAAFEPKRPSNHSAELERIAYLEKRIQTKDEVLAELMAEHVALKKRLGNSDRGLGSARHTGPDRGFRPTLVGEN